MSDYVTRLVAFLRSREFHYLVPIDDLASELVYFDYPGVASVVRVIGPPPASYALARNKVEAAALAESIGLVRPRALLLRRGESTPRAADFPCLVRPVVSGAILDDEWQRFTERKVDTIEALDAKLRDDLPRTDVMLQAPVSGARLGLNFCAIDGDVLGASVTSCLHESPKHGVSYQKVEAPNAALLATIRALAHRLAWTGFMTIDCRQGPDGLTFLGLDNSASDTMAACVSAGVNFPALVVDGLENADRDLVSMPLETIYARNLATDLRWLASRIRGGNGLMLVLSWIASLHRVSTGAERFEVEQIGDVQPAFRQFDRGAGKLRSFIEERLGSIFRITRDPALASPRLSRQASLLVVCQGNINRSVVAEYLLRAQGFEHVQSAALLPMSQRRASVHAERFLAARLGVDISKFRSQSIDRALRSMGNPDVVLCFERKQAGELARRFPLLAGRIFLFSSLEAGGGGPADIADPYGRSEEAHLSCFRRIESLVVQARAMCEEVPRP